MLDSDNVPTTEPTDPAAAPTDAPTSASPVAEAAAPVKAPRKRAAKKAAPSVDAVPASDAAADAAPAPARAPRKRAAKKAAAEPATATAGSPADAPPTTTPAADAAEAPTPDRAPRKRAAKKATPAARAATKAEVPVEGEVPLAATAQPETADVADAPAPAKAARKRTPRKAAAKAAPLAVGAADEIGADPAESPADPAESPAGGAPAAESAPGVLFMPPAETTADPPRRRRAAKKAGPKAAGSTGEETDGVPDRTAESAAVDDTTADDTPVDDTPADDLAEPEAGDVDLRAVEGEEDETADPEDVREAAIEQASGARRRRRRGRRGRGGSGGRADTEQDESDGDDHGSTDDKSGEDTANDAGEEAEESSSSSRRRRRRRRAGTADDAEGTDDPPNTVVHVRDGKKADGKKAKDDGDDGVRGVKGSTRLEAKRQRRRDGRETNRRRAPILTEAEFLARREAVDRVMAVREHGDRTQIAVLEDDILVEHYVTRASSTSYVGNVYVGRVQNVLPSMEAAFIDIGKGRNGVLYAGEVNWDAAGLEGKSRAIEQALKSGDSVLVQVTKDPIGHKGARLTSQISLPGRFLVLVPGGGMTGISRRLPDTERHRLKSILKKIVPDDAGVIVRTAAEGASEEDLTHDVERLTAQWEQIQQQAAKAKSAPVLVHGEPDIAIRVVRDVFNEDFKKLVVQGDGVWSTVSEYLNGVAPDLAERLTRHTADTDLFHDLRVDEQLAKALDRKVWLPSGGSLVIDRTEAMTVIDVNTGKFIGSGGNLEQTVTRNNLEAAEEIVRQLRLRDVGGIVVIDFIDMVLESNRELVLRRLTECLGRDRTKHQVAEVTSLGLVQMTRKRVGEGLLEAFSETCEHCHGRGIIVHSEPVDKQSGGSGDGDDDRPQGGSKSRRRRGKGAAATEQVELSPAVDEEQRQVANAAIAAIHRAAGGEKPDSGVALVDEFATGLFTTSPEAAAEVAADAADDEDAADSGTADSGSEAPPASRRRRRVATRPAAAPAESEPAVVVVEPTVDAPVYLPAPASEAPVPAGSANGSSPAPTETTDDAPAEDGATPAPRRRRRAASRPAGPPTA